jgi:hypothetical protein
VQPIAAITVSLLPDGRVNVQGQFDNKVVALGLLAMGQKYVADYDPAKQPGLVIPAPKVVEALASQRN